MATSAVAGQGIAEPYAAALFELALESDCLDEVERNLDELRGLLASSEDLACLVRSPLFARQEQAAALGEVVARAGFSDLVARFLGQMAVGRRLRYLAGAIDEFDLMLDRHRGTVRVDVTAAQTLDAGQVEALREAIASGTGGDVRVRVTEDPRLLGGLFVRIGSRMIDASVRSRLERMRVAMREVR